MTDIVFDFDGTIADSKELLIELINQFSGQYGYRRVEEESEILELNQLPIRERMKRVGMPVFKLPFILHDIKGEYHRRIQELKPIHQMNHILERLYSDGYFLSIVTSNHERNVKSFLKLHNIDYFRYIHSERNVFGKAKVLRHYLKQRHLRANEVVYIGDEQRDIVACKEVGIRILAVTWGVDPLSLLIQGNPDKLIHTPHDIYEYIKGND